MRKQKKEDYWVSISDMMTGLMIIFMFIAIAYILEVRKEQEARDSLFEDFQLTKEKLFHDLDSVFGNDFKIWDVELDRDLSIKFTNPEVLFAPNSAAISDRFRMMLEKFIPKYLDIILKEEYADKISEVRIEGHTDTIPTRLTNDSYLGNLILSQQRSAEVLQFLRGNNHFNKLSIQNKNKLQFWLTANGLSYGRTLDKNKKLTVDSNEAIDNKLSRRVEFKIVTTSNELVEAVIKNLKK